jgi:hypothetical protein
MEPEPTLASGLLAGVREALATTLPPAAEEPVTSSLSPLMSLAPPPSAVAQPLSQELSPPTLAENGATAEVVEQPIAIVAAMETSGEEVLVQPRELATLEAAGETVAPAAVSPQRLFFQFGAEMSATPGSFATPPVPELVMPAAAVSAEVASASPAQTPEELPAGGVPEGHSAEEATFEGGAYSVAAEEDEQVGGFAIDTSGFTALSAESAGGEAAVASYTQQRLAMRRKPAEAHPIRFFVGLVVMGFLGAFIAYSILCLMFGAEADFFHVYQKAQRPAVVKQRRENSSARTGPATAKKADPHAIQPDSAFPDFPQIREEENKKPR